MKEILRLAEGNEGFVFFFESSNHPPMQTQHTHRELELNLIVSGTASYLLPGRKYTLQKGSLVWLFPKQAHMISERSKNFSMYVAVFSTTMVEELSANSRYEALRSKKPQGNFCRTISDEKFRTIHAICKALCGENPTASTTNLLKNYAGSAYGYGKNEVYSHGNANKLNTGLRFILLEAWDSFEHVEEQAFSELHPSVEKAVLKLNNQENYPSILESNLEKLSYECDLSPGRLSRLFHSQIGTPLILYRNQKRLEYFQRLFTQSQNITLSEAAFSAGFGSYAQFQKSFIKEYGYSPKVFKDMLRKDFHVHNPHNNNQQ